MFFSFFLYRDCIFETFNHTNSKREIEFQEFAHTRESGRKKATRGVRLRRGCKNWSPTNDLSSFSFFDNPTCVRQPVGEPQVFHPYYFFLTNLGDSMEHEEIFFERKKEAKLVPFASFLISKKVEGSLTNDLRPDSGATRCASFCFVDHHLDDIYAGQEQRGKQHLPRHFVFPCLSNAAHRDRVVDRVYPLHPVVDSKLKFHPRAGSRRTHTCPFCF